MRASFELCSSTFRDFKHPREKSGDSFYNKFKTLHSIRFEEEKCHHTSFTRNCSNCLSSIDELYTRKLKKDIIEVSKQQQVLSKIYNEVHTQFQSAQDKFHKEMSFRLLPWESDRRTSDLNNSLAGRLPLSMTFMNKTSRYCKSFLSPSARETYHMSLLAGYNCEISKAHIRSKSVGFCPRGSQLYWDEAAGTFLYKQTVRSFRCKNNSLEKWTKEEKRKIIEFLLRDYYKNGKKGVKLNNSSGSTIRRSLDNFNSQLQNQSVILKNCSNLGSFINSTLSGEGDLNNDSGKLSQSGRTRISKNEYSKVEQRSLDSFVSDSDTLRLKNRGSTKGSFLNISKDFKADPFNPGMTMYRGEENQSSVLKNFTIEGKYLYLDI